MSTGAIEYLPPVAGLDAGTRGTVVNHRMREVTEQVAHRGTWNGEVLGEVRALFGGLAGCLGPKVAYGGPNPSRSLSHKSRF